MATEAILDSSIIIALVTQEKYSEWSNEKLQSHQYFHSLDLSFYEIANSLRFKCSDKFDAKDIAIAYKRAEKIMDLTKVHYFSEILPEALNNAVELKITVYDAAFLSLASKLKIPFITLDLKLVNNLQSTKYKELIEYPK